jgi:hypothetical protein
MLVAEQELAIQITQINRVQVDNMYLAKTRQHQVFEQFAADAAGSNHKHARLQLSVSILVCAALKVHGYLFDAGMQGAEAALGKGIANHCERVVKSGCEEGETCWTCLGARSRHGEEDVLLLLRR